MPFFSTTITTATTAQPIMINKLGIRKVTQIQLAIRSMGAGGATYAAIGGLDSQDRRLASVGANIGIDTPQGKRYLDVTELYIISDAAGVVVEILGDSFV